eukprot:CAMPEP_0201260132 /NCGR_PEP_ID=MMETSP0853-20130426/4447_1 /ASSEMBLY_ACC=CAM_ASM_000640 /TAXON_ID=183588 /ORGANISM="Pseudo-nitzschia fraudulenta, Strain WWA7" /LENGTH=367 /DNA_ID=CAMNT_0047562607 /DNA_START=809 /DNA_END=1913 /DNA_ORIENTATION=+
MFNRHPTHSQHLLLATLAACCGTGRPEDSLWAPPISVRPRSPIVSSDDMLAEIKANGNMFVLLGFGNFWSAEQTLEEYAPGVVEVVSGYAGRANENLGSVYGVFLNSFVPHTHRFLFDSFVRSFVRSFETRLSQHDDKPCRHHPDQKEVVLVEYDPEKTTYELLVKYAYHNTDPFENEGQFCDTGTSYLPAIYYQTDEEFIVAETVLAEVLELNPDLSEEDIAVPILKMPWFRKAGEQDQDFYIRHPEPYAHYKNNCGRSERLKEVWGEEVYDCYHDETHSCFVPGEMIAAVITDGMIVTAITDGSNVTDDLLLVGKILNSYGDVVVAESNTKSAPEGEKPLDVVGIILISLAVLAVLVCVVKANLP